MRHPDVTDAVMAAFLARSEITDVMGSAVYLDGGGGDNRAFEVPSLTVLVVSDVESELWEHIDIQVDIFTRERATCNTVENVIRWLLHTDRRLELGDVKMFGFFVDGRTLFGPGKDRYFGRSLDFRLEPIRSKYMRVVES